MGNKYITYFIICNNLEFIMLIKYMYIFIIKNQRKLRKHDLITLSLIGFDLYLKQC